MRIIGDVHGLWDQYYSLIKDVPESIQVGDMGVGFPITNPNKEKQIYDKFREKTSEGNHRFIRGNHDNPEVCRRMDSWIQDGTVFPDKKLMVIGGAWSIDQQYRIPGITWWADEELSYKEFDSLIEVYEQEKPEVMITHDCPTEVALEMFIKTGQSLGGSIQITTRTGEALQRMFEIHQTKYWFFGHWHVTKEANINGTHFHCLGELDYIDFDFEKLEYI